MRISAAFILLSLLSPIGAAEPKVLVTSFMPFAGRQTNGSATLARSLAGKVEGVSLKVVEIPVVWGEVESKTSKLIDDWRPELIIGLGEGKPGHITFETFAVNERVGRDEKGNAPETPCVVKDGKSQLKSTISYEWSDAVESTVPVMIGRTESSYLCNNALYFFLSKGRCRSGFIHFPAQGNTSDEEYLRLCRPFLVDVIKQNVKKLASR